jgi:hypothetical protein
MSPKLARIEARIEARVFRADSVRFEACPAFRPVDDAVVCGCGWLEGDHAGSASTIGRTRHFPRRRPERVPERRAS